MGHLFCCILLIRRNIRVPAFFFFFYKQANIGNHLPFGAALAAEKGQMD